jgi:LysM repeat protein
VSSPTTPPIGSRTRRWLRRGSTSVVATTAGAVLLAGAPTQPEAATDPSRPDPSRSDAPSAPIALVSSAGKPWPGHPGRRLVSYRVKPGDTATGLAVRFHAWTDELRAVNHLGRHSRLYVGQRIRIPVVLAALRKHRHARVHRHHPVRHHKTQRPARAKKSHKTHKPPVRHATRHRSRHPKPWALADVSRGKVRRVVIRVAQRHGVDPDLALAISWQESGWQQRRVSSAGAIGAMQVLPSTGRWMSTYVDRPLNVYGLYDNVTAGVYLIKVLQSQTSPRKAVAAYYQGLGAVQKYGLFSSTRHYVRNVLHLRKRIHGGWNPA